MSKTIVFDSHPSFPKGPVVCGSKALYTKAKEDMIVPLNLCVLLGIRGVFSVNWYHVDLFE